MKIRTIILVIFCVVFLALSCLFFTLSTRSHTYNINIGDSVSFGAYEQDNDLSNGYEPIEWKVISVSDDKAVLLSDKILDFSVFKNMNPSLECNVHWNNSFVRSWLNNEFLNMAFSDEEINCIVETLNKNINNPITQDSSEEDTNDKVYLLSFSDLIDYGFCDKMEIKGNNKIERLEYYHKIIGMEDLQKKDDRKCSATDYALKRFHELTDDSDTSFEGLKKYDWWLRLKGTESNLIGVIYENGEISLEGHFADDPYIGIRPAITVNLLSDFCDICNKNKELEHIIKTEVEELIDIADLIQNNKHLNIEIGDSVIFGDYEQNGNQFDGKEPIEWIVISKSENGVCLLSKYVLDYRSYDDSDKSVIWDNSSINQWLNEVFINEAFSDAEKKAVFREVLLPTTGDMLKDGIGFEDDILEYDTNRTASATKYVESLYFEDNKDATEYNKRKKPWGIVYYYTRDMLPAFEYWLQDIDKNTENGTYAQSVSIKGSIESSHVSIKMGIRPKIYLKY